MKARDNPYPLANPKKSITKGIAVNKIMRIYFKDDLNIFPILIENIKYKMKDRALGSLKANSEAPNNSEDTRIKKVFIK